MLSEIYKEGYLTTRCMGSMTFDQLILDAFDQLGHYYISQSQTTASNTLSSGLAADFMRIRAKVDATSSGQQTVSRQPIIPPQLTPQRLGHFLGAQGLCWVIEDFHKIAPQEKLPLAQSLKIFSDLAHSFPHLKIIAVGATDTAREVVEYDREMAHRVDELLVPLMNEQELRSIINNGQALLNIDLSAMREEIVHYSMGLGAVCHQLALNVCRESGILETKSEQVILGPISLSNAVARYVRESSDTLKLTFDQALRRHKVRRYDNCRLILRALASGPIDGLLHADLIAKIREGEPDYPASNLTLYLRDLSSERRGTILRQGLDGRYRFVDPLYHAFALASLVPQSTNYVGKSQLLQSLVESLRELPSFAFKFDPESLLYIEDVKSRLNRETLTQYLDEDEPKSRQSEGGGSTRHSGPPVPPPV
jgi:hypothetical protein